MAELCFAKMEGLGNDFVVVDAVAGAARLTPGQIRRMADRRRGIGFDQLLYLEPGTEGAEFGMSIFNADGSRAEQCGNGVRCLALFAARRGLTAADNFSIQSSGRRIEVRLVGEAEVSCDMGAPSFEPAHIPFQADAKSDWYPLEVGSDEVRLGAVSIGNPHAVVAVPDAHAAPVEHLGPAIESHPRFPNRVNVGFMQVLDRGAIRLRVFERGVGETQACGTGACAAAVVGHQNGLLDERVNVQLAGGELDIVWEGGTSSIWMTGPATWVYEGKIEV